MTGVEEKVIVVTGGANGIGRRYCEQLFAEGARIVIADIDTDGAHALATHLNEIDGERALPVPGDLTRESDAEGLIEATVKKFGRIDVLVNNAGSYPHVPIERIGYEDWRRVLAINLDTVFLCSRAALGVMKGQGDGKIVNVATNLVWSGLPEMAHYIAAKAGVVGFTRALARELGPYGITVNAVAPGAVIPDVPMSEENRRRAAVIVEYQCVKRTQRPEDLLGMMTFLCSEESNFISGQVFTVDGGLTMH